MAQCRCPIGNREEVQKPAFRRNGGLSEAVRDIKVCTVYFVSGRDRQDPRPVCLQKRFQPVIQNTVCVVYREHNCSCALDLAGRRGWAP